METTADKIKGLLSPCKNLAHMSLNSDIFSSTLKKEASNVLECIPQILKLLEETESWIPCSERMPNESDVEDQLVSLKDGRVEPDIWHENGWINNINSNVLAWMTFPKSYKK